MLQLYVTPLRNTRDFWSIFLRGSRINVEELLELRATTTINPDLAHCQNSGPGRGFKSPNFILDPLRSWPIPPLPRAPSAGPDPGTAPVGARPHEPFAIRSPAWPARRADPRLAPRPAAPWPSRCADIPGRPWR